MLEIVATILLVLLSVLMATASGAAKKGKSFLEQVSDAAEAAAGGYVALKTAKRATGKRLFSDEQRYELEIGDAEYRLAREHPGIYAASGLLKYLVGGERAGNIVRLTNYLTGGKLSYFTPYGLEESEERETWTAGYVGRREAEDIYREITGRVPKSIKERYAPLDSSGTPARAVTQLDKDEVTVEVRLDRGSKLHAHHHEAYHKQNPSWSEGEVERAVWEHYAKDPLRHREEIRAVDRYYTELKKNRPEIFREIEKQFVGG